jgi:hypothetical protein
MEKPEVYRKETKGCASDHSKREFDEYKLWAMEGNIQGSKFTYIDKGIVIFHMEDISYTLFDTSAEQ